MKKKKKNVDSKDADELVDQDNRQVTLVRDATWRDMLALTKVLVSYGCLKSDWAPGDSDDDLEASSFTLTTAGEHIGMLSFENSLWSLVAMGGAHDVLGVSSELDEFKRKLKEFEGEYNVFDDRVDDTELLDDMLASFKPKEEEEQISPIVEAQQESMTLASQLSQLKSHELAGYVSCLLADGYRRGNSPSIAESFQRLTPSQQRVVQSCLAVCERLIEVQKQCETGDTNTRTDLDLSTVEVVTSWASGCSWSEALEISGSAPGDLARMLGRVLDALRQFGNLSFNPVRVSDMNEQGVQKASLGITTEVRNLCRDAARAMNRYPVKDPLPFDTDTNEVEDDFDDDDAVEIREEGVDESDDREVLEES